MIARICSVHLKVLYSVGRCGVARLVVEGSNRVVGRGGVARHPRHGVVRGGAGVAGGELLVLLHRVLPLAHTEVLRGLAEAGVLGLIVAQVLGLCNSRVLGLVNAGVLGLVNSWVLGVRRNSVAVVANLPILRLLEKQDVRRCQESNRMSVD